MTEDISPDSPDEKKILDETLRRLRNNDRHPVPSANVKLFLQMVGDELKLDISEDAVNEVLGR